MGQPFLGEIRMFGGNFPPLGWMFCSGQLLPISEFSDLFTLIGTTYGGDGESTFALPNLQGRIPLHQGSGFTIGQVGGEETHTLTVNEIAAHSHTVNAATAASSDTPAGNVFAGGPALFASSPSTPMSAAMIALNSGGQPHDNMMPFLAVSFIIAVQGIFPQPS